ncbi:hypothetical protein BaRGS_00018576 [Batillaria attramentaria]|uniref:Uncharacterized protein n=1 Tax=Batillaria attramentaria TaxID=370345 RepID=A0ABD0KT25_9CAEN
MGPVAACPERARDEDLQHRGQCPHPTRQPPPRPRARSPAGTCPLSFSRSSTPRPHPGHDDPVSQAEHGAPHSTVVSRQRPQLAVSRRPSYEPFHPVPHALDGRLPPSPFNRPPGLDLPIDLLEHYRMRPHLGTVVMTPAPNMEPHFAHSAFDRTRPMSTLETQIYSQRLKQLANTTLPPGLISPMSGAHFTQPGVLTPLSTGDRSSRGGRDSVGSGRDSSSGGVEHDRERRAGREERREGRGQTRGWGFPG